MSKGVVAEESLRQYLLDVSPSSGFVVGLLLGQRCEQRCYIAHMPIVQNSQQKSDEDSEKSSTAKFTSLQDVTSKTILGFGKQVLSFLPGGLNILGIFSCSANDVGLLEASQAPKLQTLLTTLFGKLDPLILTATPNPEKFVVHFNSTTDKVSSKTVNIADSKWYLANMDWKFQAVSWQTVESKYGFDMKLPVQEKNDVTSLKSCLASIFKIKCDEIKSAHCFLEGEIQDSNTLLEAISDGDINAEILLPCYEDSNQDIEYLKCSGDLIMNGSVYSRVYMQPKSSVTDVISALKEDIARSLQIRFDLHTDTLIEEEEGSPEEKVVQHELPRRILIPLPYSDVKLSNYLFPGETSKDSLASVTQLFGYEVDEDKIEAEVEQEADPDLLLPAEELVCSSTPQPETEPEQSFMTLYTALAVGVLFLALCTTLLLIRDEDEAGK